MERKGTTDKEHRSIQLEVGLLTLALIGAIPRLTLLLISYGRHSEQHTQVFWEHRKGWVTRSISRLLPSMLTGAISIVITSTDTLIHLSLNVSIFSLVRVAGAP